MDEFEQKLKTLGYNLNLFKEDGICSHKEKNCIYYVQECSCCIKLKKGTKNKELDWWKYMACEKCMDSDLGCLDCGGHYSNIRIFKDNIDVSDDYYSVNGRLYPDSFIYSSDEE